MSFVYFMEAKGLNAVKIGFAADPWKRLSKVQTDSPVPVEIIGFEPGTLALESELHRRFAEHRLNREWFRLALPVRDYVASLPTVMRPRRARMGGPLGKWMHDNNLDCRAAAKVLGINISTISNMCAGKRIPRRDAMLRIYRMTNGAVSPNGVYGIENEAHVAAEARSA